MLPSPFLQSENMRNGCLAISILVAVIVCVGEGPFAKTSEKSAETLPREPLESAPDSLNEARRLTEHAEILLMQDNWESALDNLNEATRLVKETAQWLPRLHLLQGIIYQDEFKNYRQAAIDYEIYLAKPDADETIALKRLARAYFDLGMLYKSLFNTAVNTEADYYTYKLQLAELLPGAVAPDDMPYLRYFRGLCYYLSERFDEAIKDLKQVATSDSPYYLAQLKLAACYHRSGQEKQAEQILTLVQRSIDREADRTSSVMLNSEIWRTHLELGHMEHVDQALQACRQAVELSVDKTQLNRAERNLSYVYYCQGDVGQALAHLRNLDVTVPDSTVSLSELLRERIVASKYTDEDAQWNLDVPYYDPSVLQQQYSIYFELAKQMYTKLLPILNDPNIELQIGLCYLHTRQLGRATPILEALQAKSTDELFRARAIIYLGISKYLSDPEHGPQEAQRLWRELLERFPDDEYIRSEIAYHWAALNGQPKEDLPLRIAPRQLGYVYLQRGIHEQDPDKRLQALVSASLHLERSRFQVGYLFDDPLLLVELTQSYYHRRHFYASAAIWRNLLAKYPEVIQILNAMQIIGEISIIWPYRLGEMPNPQWMNLNYTSGLSCSKGPP